MILLDLFIIVIIFMMIMYVLTSIPKLQTILDKYSVGVMSSVLVISSLIYFGFLILFV